MTTPIAREVSRRRARPRTGPVLASLDLRDTLLAHLSATTGVRFPDPSFWAEPVQFFRHILGVEPWSRQIDLMHAIRDHDRVACKAGRKVSKSHSFSGIALCWYCSFTDARVVMSSVTDRQVNAILWYELMKMHARSGRCVACKTADPGGLRIPRPCGHSGIIDGELGQLARTGLKSHDFREIVGFTARQGEAVQGISGARLIYLLDEASGIPQIIYEAVEGNRAGGAKALYMGNPTRTSGEFFEAFGKKAKSPENPTGYYCLTISSEESPNVAAKKIIVPGLATDEWIREREQEWGRESALFKIHVLGEFATNEDGKIFSVHTISAAEQRWRDSRCSTCAGEGIFEERTCAACDGTGRTPAEGRLFVGVDPAGPSGTGDETAFVARRGLRVLEVLRMRGLSAEAHCVHVLGLCTKHKLKRERPVVVVDREGPVGSNVYGMLTTIAAPDDAPIEVTGIRSSDRAHRQPFIYDRMRDELAANLEAWFRDGGAIPEDAKLAKELHTLEWVTQQSGRIKLTPKDVIRKEIGRSPDSADALMLACWEALSLREGKGQTGSGRDDEDDVLDADPYGGQIDPYGGA